MTTAGCCHPARRSGSGPQLPRRKSAPWRRTSPSNPGILASPSRFYSYPFSGCQYLLQRIFLTPKCATVSFWIFLKISIIIQSVNGDIWYMLKRTKLLKSPTFNSYPPPIPQLLPWLNLQFPYLERGRTSNRLIHYNGLNLSRDRNFDWTRHDQIDRTIHGPNL